MTPAVTQAEKDKRRRKHVTARQQRGKAGIGNQKPLPPAKPGADQLELAKRLGYRTWEQIQSSRLAD